MSLGDNVKQPKSETARSRRRLVIRKIIDSALGLNHAFLVACVLVGIISGCSIFPACFSFDETGAMYFLSSIPQVIAAFVGLTIAGYAIAEDSFRRRAEEDETLEEIIGDIRERLRTLLVQIIAIATLGIIASFLGIADYSNQTGENDWIYKFVLDASGSLLLATLYLIAVLVWNVSNPNLIQEISDAAKKELDDSSIEAKKEASLNPRGSDLDSLAEDELQHDAAGKNNLAQFISGFNSLGEQLIGFAKEAGYHPFKDRAGVMGSVNFLAKHGYLNEEEYEDLRDLIQYRNYLVHGTDMQVDDAWIKKLSRIYLAIPVLLHGRLDNQATREG